jgi:hypothetical protein
VGKRIYGILLTVFVLPPEVNHYAAFLFPCNVVRNNDLHFGLCLCCKGCLLEPLSLKEFSEPDLSQLKCLTCLRKVDDNGDNRIYRNLMSPLRNVIPTPKRGIRNAYQRFGDKAPQIINFGTLLGRAVIMLTTVGFPTKVLI